MRHLIFGSIALFLALIVIITYFLRDTGSSEPVPVPISSFPDVSSPNGFEPRQSVVGERILALPTTEVWTEGEYLVAEQKNIGSNLYQIFYNADFDVIGISIENEAVGVAREAAEQKLIELTGFTEGALCQADVSVTVPVQVSERFSGKNLGLSFCPGSVDLQ